MKVGYLPIITKGGDVFRDVFDWQSAIVFIDETLRLFKDLGYEAIYIGTPVSTADSWKNSEKIFIENKIDALFIHNLNIAGGEFLYKLVKKLNVPVIVSSIPEPAGLYEPPYIKRYASYCGGQWNMNMCYLAGIKAKFLFGLPSEEEFIKKLDYSLKAIEVINKLNYWKVCLIGSKTPGYYGAIFSEDMLMRKFNSIITYLDFGTINILKDKISDKEAYEFIKNYFKKDQISDLLSKEQLNNTVKTYLVLEKYAKENNIDSFTMKCVPETVDLLGICPCGINSLLTENNYISGCEGDILSTLTMQICYLLNKKKPLQVDIMSIREKDDSLLLWHCGAGAPSIANGNVVKYTNSPILCDRSGSPLGVCVDFIPKYEDVTLCQLSEDWQKGNYRFFVAYGNMIETKPFIGGNSIKVKFKIAAEALGFYITENYLPHHFQVTGGNLCGFIKEICFWKSIDLLEV